MNEQQCGICNSPLTEARSKGVLVDVRCSSCGSKPIDWLRDCEVYPASTATPVAASFLPRPQQTEETNQ